MVTAILGMLLAGGLSTASSSLEPRDAETTRYPVEDASPPEEQTERVHPRVSAQYYYDTREYSTLGLTIATKGLPFGFQLWGFTDFHGAQQSDSQRHDKRRSFSEYRLSHGILGEWLGVDGLAFQAEYNDGTPNAKDDRVRFGATLRHRLPIPYLEKPGWLQWRVFPLETDGPRGQLSLIYNVPLHERVVITGFADYNILDESPNRWVIEPQLNFKVADRCWLVTEFRYNEFEVASAAVRGIGWAFGLRYDL